MKTLKVGETKRGKRIWIEGKDLINAGFTHKTPYYIQYENNTVHYIADKGGKRKVAGTPARPIIDLVSKTKLNTFGNTIEVQFGLGIIFIKSN